MIAVGARQSIIISPGKKYLLEQVEMDLLEGDTTK